MFAKIKKLCNHERYQVVSCLFIIGFMIWMIGCQPTVRSLSNPTVTVTRSELQAELDFLIAQADIRFSDLNQQDELRRTLSQNALIWAQTGAINPMGVMVSIFGILGVGATVDNVRKRKVISDTEKAIAKNT